MNGALLALKRLYLTVPGDIIFSVLAMGADKAAEPAGLFKYCFTLLFSSIELLELRKAQALLELNTIHCHSEILLGFYYGEHNMQL